MSRLRTLAAVVLLAGLVALDPTSAPAPAAPEGGPPPLDLRPIANVPQPMALAARPGSNHLFVAERQGRVRLIRVQGDDFTLSPNVVVDLRDRTTTSDERGLLGLTFNPAGTKLYVHFTNNAGNTRVVEYRMSNNGRGNGVVKSSRRIVFRVGQPFANHNGGELTFGPDGRMYLALGDGGSGGDPFGNGQNLRTLLGKVLRINPNAASGGRNFTPPASNPFFNQPPRRKAIWLYGVRNPWRLSFDQETGDLYVADVGQRETEEVTFLAADGSGLNAGRGANLGWARMEGDHPFNGRTEPPNHADPVFTYDHDATGGCAVVGGYVYRGGTLPALDGTYLYGDLCTGTIGGLRVSGGGNLSASFPDLGIGVGPGSLWSFGQGRDGEVYVLSGNSVGLVVPD